MSRCIGLLSSALLVALSFVGVGLVGTGRAAVAAEPAYFILDCGELEFKNVKPDGTPLDIDYDWNRMSTVLPYVVLDGPGEAYWYSNATYGFRLNADREQRGKIAVRLPESGKEVSGRLFHPTQDFRKYDVLKFTIPAEKASPDRKKQFYTAKGQFYEALRTRNIPGVAWFRHEARLAEIEAFGKSGRDGDNPQRRDLFQPGRDLDDTFSLLTGNRAVSENLQLDRALPPPRNQNVEDGEIGSVDEIKGVTVKEIDWKPLLKDKNPKLDPLAASIPADQHVVFFPSFEAMMQLADEADRQGTPLLQVAEPQSQQVNVVERYQRQIGLGRTAIGRLLGPQLIKSIALTGSDGYFRIGTDLGLVFEPQDLTSLQAAILGQITVNTGREKELKKESGEYAGVAYTHWHTPTRTVHTYLATVGKNVVVTNSLAQLKRLVDVQQEKTPAITSLDEYKFFRDRYQLGHADETAFLFLSDPTIRRWCSPRWRIADSRRVRDLGVLAELQAENITKLAAEDFTPSVIQTSLPLSTSGEVRLEADGVRSSSVGSLDYMTPIIELPLERVTKWEASAYERWRDGYQRNFSWAFDPIALRFTVNGQKIGADLTVMPLIEGSEYRQFIALSRGAKLAPESGDPHGAVVQFIFALNKEAPTVQQYTGMARLFAPQLKADPLGWFGNWITVYADDSPLWDEMAKLKTDKEARDYLRDHGYELPVALGFEVTSALKATAFLVALRAFAEQTAPGMSVWESKQIGEDSYVKISPSAKAVQPRSPEAKFSVYYALTSESLVVSLNEKLIQGVVTRKSKRDAKPEEVKPEARPTDSKTEVQLLEAVAKSSGWLGENFCAEVSDRALQVFAVVASRTYQSEMQKLAWDNLPILNEWHRMFPDQDPVALHERVWGVRLTCPGGGKYVWNETWQTMESTVYGHPAEPKLGTGAPPQLQDFSRAGFGLTFEEQGLRARAEMTRKK